MFRETSANTGFQGAETMKTKMALTALALIVMNSGGWHTAQATSASPEVLDNLNNKSNDLWKTSEQSDQVIQVQAKASATDTKDDLLNAALPPADSDMSDEVEPLRFSALGIGCRQSYFADALESCTAEILLDVTLTQETAKLLGNQVKVSCDVGFAFEADGQPGSETVNQTSFVDIKDGIGRRAVEARINFLSLDSKVTRIELTDLTCETLGPGAS